MKKNCLQLIKICLPVLLFAAVIARGQNEITIEQNITVMGMTKPIPVSLEGFSGETLDVLKFDLYVQGFSFVGPDAAQYLISGSNAGNVQGRVTDRLAKSSLLARSYTGASLRREAHAFADDIVLAITGKKGIAQTKIAFKAKPPTATAKFTLPISTATIRRPSPMTAPSWPRPRGCPAGSRFITPPTSSATRTFFITTSPPASAAPSRAIPA